MRQQRLKRAAATGKCRLKALQNPTVVGSPVAFMVDVRNGQNLQDTNLRIQLALPEGMN